MEKDLHLDGFKLIPMELMLLLMILMSSFIWSQEAEIIGIWKSYKLLTLKVVAQVNIFCEVLEDRIEGEEKDNGR